MNFSLNFGSIGIAKTLYLISMNVFMMYVGKLICMCKLCVHGRGKILWLCAWIYLWVLENFVVMKF